MTDGLKGMPDALEAIFPQTTLQTGVVHLIRHSLAYTSYRDRRPLALALRTVYTAPTAEAAAAALDASPLGARFPTVTGAWRRAWTQTVPFFAFPPAVRRVLYTTNALENVNRQLRKMEAAVRVRGLLSVSDRPIRRRQPSPLVAATVAASAVRQSRAPACADHGVLGRCRASS